MKALIFFLLFFIHCKALGDVLEFINEGEVGYIENFTGSFQKENVPKHFLTKKNVAHIDDKLLRALSIAASNLRKRRDFSEKGETVLFKLNPKARKGDGFQAEFIFSRKSKFLVVDKKTKSTEWVTLKKLRIMKTNP